MRLTLQSFLARNLAAASIVGLAVLGFVATGCTNATTKPVAESHDHEGEDHGHEHSHRHGDHGGEIAVLEPGDYDLEWSHNNEDGTVVMHVDAITAKSVKVDSIKVSVKVPDQEAKIYELAKQEDGTYSIKDAELATAIDASGDDESKIEVLATVVIEGKDTTAKLKNMHHH